MSEDFWTSFWYSLAVMAPIAIYLRIRKDRRTKAKRAAKAVPTVVKQETKGREQCLTNLTELQKRAEALFSDIEASGIEIDRQSLNQARAQMYDMVHKVRLTLGESDRREGPNV